MSNNEVYLGDGLYCSDDGHQIKLRAPRENGDHEIYLEPGTFQGLCQYIERFANVRILIAAADQIAPATAEEAKEENVEG